MAAPHRSGRGAVAVLSCYPTTAATIAQKAVPVRETDDAAALGRRVRKAERIIYPQAVRLFAAQRLRVDGRRVIILPE